MVKGWASFAFPRFNPTQYKKTRKILFRFLIYSLLKIGRGKELDGKKPSGKYKNLIQPYSFLNHFIVYILHHKALHDQ